MIRKDENKIKKIEIKGTKSSNFIKKYIDNDNKIIIKIDIEGSELDFLKGLEQYNFDQIDAFVVEAHFDNPYFSDSNFFSISSFLKERNYWLSSIEIEKNLISKFCEPKDSLPLSSTNIYLKNSYKPNIKVKLNIHEEMCEILFALKYEYLLMNNLENIGYDKIKKYKLFKEYKHMIGHKLYRLNKFPYLKKKR